MPKDLPLSHYEPPKPVRAGGRISSPELRASIEQAEEFNGLPEDTQRYDLLLLVKRAGKSAGFTAKMIMLLDYYMAFTRDVDWEQGGRPIVYQSLSKTALDLGVSERQIQRLEQALFEAGALTWNDSGNHRRYGQRDPQSGLILYAYGVDLSPLAYLKDELETRLHEKQLYDQAWLETKRQISWYRRQIKACMAELEEQGPAAGQAFSFLQEFERSYNAIAIQIRTHIALEDLRELLGKHKILHETVTHELDSSQMTLKCSTNQNSLKTQKESSLGVKRVTYYNSSTHKQSDKSDTGSTRDKPAPNCLQESRSRNREDKADRARQKDRSSGRQQGSGLDYPQHKQPESDDVSIIEATGLQHITLKQVLNAASPRFKEHIPLEPRPMNWNDVVEAAYKLKSQLHVSQQSWATACMTLGRGGAAICLLLTDQATQRLDDPVRKPGAYFNAMIARAKTGELHLQKSIFGILKKEDPLET